ncbi:uncharacterized protein LOC132730275 [Ruditapes philippinarum]|uniref:uncharacterized protein LOC132730275 n=1 Tax=Ruditapes philippinarum TaxID=129788 RepID=UPI00295AB83D|nr:uncharacterized protein LOC132730275 [Ruditapes philippinarum]
MTRFAAVLRTNMTSDRCPENFLKSFSEYLSKRFDICKENVILELHTNVTLLRGGSFDKAINIDIHHNSEKVNKSTKKCVAEDIADFIYQELDISKDRVLVLFFDTRRCT